MRIVIAGSSGFVGSRLVHDLRARGHEVLRLVRSEAQAEAPDAARWSPPEGELDPAVIEGADAVVNLCGRNIGESRWTRSIKEELRSSRIAPTRLLAETISALDRPPSVLLNFSATGIYGDRGDEDLDESSAPGKGFLADLCQEWEAAATAAQSQSTRVVRARLGMVIGQGGALDKMLLPFKLGLGGAIGSGRQWWPWIAMADVLGAVSAIVEDQDCAGPVNLVSEHQTRCRDFSQTLGRALRRPAVLPLPAFMARIVAGEMADHLLLASARVRPSVLSESLSYGFRMAELSEALRYALD